MPQTAVSADGADNADPRADTTDGAGDPQTTARIICLRLLERRARTRAELALALRRRGVPDAAAAAVLDRFVEVGLVDDAALASAFADASHRDRGLARRAVATKLRQRGVDEAAVAGALVQIDAEDERAAATRLVVRRLAAMSGLEPQVQVRRLVAMLARRGYSAELAQQVVRQHVPVDPW